MGLEIFSLISGFPFLPGPLERSSTVFDNSRDDEVKQYENNATVKSAFQSDTDPGNDHYQNWSGIKTKLAN